MEGTRHSVTSADGVRIGLLTAGSGLPLVQRGMGTIESWQRVWGALTAALGASFRRIALYGPPGPQATQNNWPERVAAMMVEGHAGRAAFTFLTEIVGGWRCGVKGVPCARWW